MSKSKKIEFEESSGNIFADIGLDNPEELLLRAQLGHSVRMILEKREYKQREISNLLEIKQPEVSKLMNGRYNIIFSRTAHGISEQVRSKNNCTNFTPPETRKTARSGLWIAGTMSPNIGAPVGEPGAESLPAPRQGRTLLFTTP